MSNRLKQKKEQKKPSTNLMRTLGSILNGNFLTREDFISHLPYMLFIMLLTLLYIANGYYAEGTVREINSMGNELKELRSEFITTKSDLMIHSKQSEVIKIVESRQLGLKESTTPPLKIKRTE